MHGDRHAELDALLGVVDRELHRRPGHSDAHRRHAGPGAVERHHRDLEALVLLAHEVVERDLHLGEGDRRRVRGPLTHLVLVLVDDDAGVARDDEAGDAAVPCLLVGLGVDGVVVGVLAVGDEALGAVDHPLVALAGGGGLHPTHVRAGVRLGQAEGGEQRRLASRPRYSFFSSSEAASSDRRRGQAVARERGADPRAAPGDLFLDQRAVEVAESGTAVFGGEVAVHQPQLPGLFDDVLRPGAVAVVLPGDGPDLLLREVVRHLAHALLLVGEREINHLGLSLID